MSEDVMIEIAQIMRVAEARVVRRMAEQQLGEAFQPELSVNADGRGDQYDNSQ